VATKKQREQAEALDNIRDALAACGPGGGSASATLLIHDDGGRPTNTGRSHRLTVQLIRSEWRPDPGGKEQRLRPVCAEWLTRNVATACGYRYSDAHEAIVMGGYGYSRSTEIAQHLSRLAGHALYVQAIGATFAAPDGWVDNAPKKATAAE